MPPSTLSRAHAVKCDRRAARPCAPVPLKMLLGAENTFTVWLLEGCLGRTAWYSFHGELDCSWELCNLLNKFKTKREVLVKPPWEWKGLKPHPLCSSQNLITPGRDRRVPTCPSDTDPKVLFELVRNLNSVFRLLRMWSGTPTAVFWPYLCL